MADLGLSHGHRTSRRYGSLRGLSLLASLIIFSPCWASPRSSYALFHRFGPSAMDDSSSANPSTTHQWQKRAVLEVSALELGQDEIHHRSQDRLHFTVSSLTKTDEPLSFPSSESLESLNYQISLVPQDSRNLPGELGLPDTGFALNSLPLCAFLSEQSEPKEARSTEYLNIWIRPTSSDLKQQNSTHNLQLHLLGTQWSSSAFTSPSTACRVDQPSVWNTPESQALIKSNFQKLIDNHGKSNIKVSVRQPEVLIEPVLKALPVHKLPEYLPDGTIKEPAPEKGWFGKYWMYILPIVALLVLGGGPPPEEGGGQQEQ